MLRGALIAWVVLVVILGRSLVLPNSAFEYALYVAAIVLSVQWGRGRWLPKNRMRWLKGLTSVVAILALLPATALATNQLSNAGTVEYIDFDLSQSGLTMNGEQISNVFAFDCAGQPIEGVQLFDQRGNPVTTLYGGINGDASDPAGYTDESTQQNLRYERNELGAFAGSWNVFPLREARAGMDRSVDEVRAKDAVWPKIKVSPLSPDCLAAPDPEATGAGAQPADPTGPTTPARAPSAHPDRRCRAPRARGRSRHRRAAPARAASPRGRRCGRAGRSPSGCR